MRRLVISSIAVLILLAPVVAFAAGYAYQFVYVNNDGRKIPFGTVPFPDAGPGRDYETGPISTVSAPFMIALAIYKENGINGWDGPTGFYGSDDRGLLQPGQTDIIGDIYLWAGTAVTPQALQLWTDQYRLDPGLTYKLRLVQVPVGITYTGPREWGPNHGTITLPFFATDDFMKGYMFQAEITAPVPEPSSLLALAGGLTGVVGYKLKRRRK